MQTHLFPVVETQLTALLITLSLKRHIAQLDINYNRLISRTWIKPCVGLIPMPIAIHRIQVSSWGSCSKTPNRIQLTVLGFELMAFQKVAHCLNHWPGPHFVHRSIVMLEQVWFDIKHMHTSGGDGHVGMPDCIDIPITILSTDYLNLLPNLI